MKALILLDMQNFIVTAQSGDKRKEYLKECKKVLTQHRKKKDTLIIFVKVCFRDGYPSVSDNNALFSMIKANGLLQRDDPNADIVKELKPKKGEVVIEKRRISAFHGTDLNTILTSNSIKEITMFGVSTGGAVLSTSVDAADLDYKVTILKRCCSDRNQEMHDLLVNKVLPIRSKVV